MLNNIKKEMKMPLDIISGVKSVKDLVDLYRGGPIDIKLFFDEENRSILRKW